MNYKAAQDETTMPKYTIDDLTDQQREFVEKYMESGGDRAAARDIVKQVYNCTTEASVTSTTYRLLNSDKIKDVMADRVLTSFAPMAVTAANALNEMIETGMWHGQIVKPADAIRAITKVLDRGIGSVVNHTEHHIKDERSREELEQAVKDKINQLSETDRRKLISEGVIDADFTEVSDISEVVDPAAPRGRKSDGSARQRPGRKPEKRRLPGPDAFIPETDSKSDVDMVRTLINKKKRAAAEEVTRNDNGDD